MDKRQSVQTVVGNLLNNSTHEIANNSSDHRLEVGVQNSSLQIGAQNTIYKLKSHTLKVLSSPSVIQPEFENLTQAFMPKVLITATNTATSKQ